MQKSRQRDPPSGVYAALATPRRPNSVEVDAAAMLDYLDAVVKAGVNGLVLFGSTGEFFHFDIAERNRVVALAIRRSRVPVLVNVSHSSLEGAIDLGDHAMSFGAAGLLLMPPYFFRYPAAQIEEFYRTFRREMDPDHPVFLYNIPQFTNEIAPEAAIRLLREGAFAGIKDSSSNWPYFEQLLALRQKNGFVLMGGNETFFLESRAQGADGIISGISAAIPELLVALNQAFETRHLERAELLNQRLNEFAAWVNRFPATIAVKQAAALRGWPLNYTAVPFDEATCHQLADFQTWFRAWWPEVLGECSGKATTRS